MVFSLKKKSITHKGFEHWLFLDILYFLLILEIVVLLLQFLYFFLNIYLFGYARLACRI